MSEAEKAKRFAIKVIEKDFDQLEAWRQKWSKQKGEEFTIDEVVDYVLQTATVRIEALEKYAKKQKAARKEAAAKKPAKAKKQKAAAPKKPRKTKAPKESAPASEPAAPAASSESAPA